MSKSRNTLLGFRPSHLREWADDLYRPTGYVSTLVKFLRDLADSVESGKIVEPKFVSMINREKGGEL